MNSYLENQLNEAVYEKQDISLKHAIGEENIDKVNNKWSSLKVRDLLNDKHSKNKDDYDTLRN